MAQANNYNSGGNNYQENIKSGYICLYRSIRKSWIWENEKYIKWWLHIIMSVNYKRTRVLVGNEFVICERGQSIRSLQTWAEELRTTKSAVQRFFKLLKSDQMINTIAIRKSTLITVCNYDDYNNFDQNGRYDTDTIAIRSKNQNSSYRSENEDENIEYSKSDVNNSKSITYKQQEISQSAKNIVSQKTKTASTLTCQKIDTMMIRSYGDLTNSKSINNALETRSHRYDNRYDDDTMMNRIAIPNNNYNKENNISISKGAEIENFENSPTRTESPPSSAAPPPQFHPMRANLPIPIEECLEVFMTNPYTEKYRMMIANLGDFLGRFDVMREWAEAFNRNLHSENAHDYGIDQWCKRFFQWLNKIPDVRTRDPKEINSLSLKSQDNGNQSTTNGKQGSGSGQYRYSKPPKGPTMGGFTPEQIRQFYEDGLSLGGREEHL